MAALVSWTCQNKCPPTRGLDPAEMNSVPVLEAGILEPRLGYFWRLRGRTCSVLLSQLCWLLANVVFSAHRGSPPISASVLRQHSPLCSVFASPPPLNVSMSTCPFHEDTGHLTLLLYDLNLNSITFVKTFPNKVTCMGSQQLRCEQIFSGVHSSTHNTGHGRKVGRGGR